MPVVFEDPKPYYPNTDYSSEEEDWEDSSHPDYKLYLEYNLIKTSWAEGEYSTLRTPTTRFLLILNTSIGISLSQKLKLSRWSLLPSSRPTSNKNSNSGLRYPRSGVCQLTTPFPRSPITSWTRSFKGSYWKTGPTFQAHKRGVANNPQHQGHCLLHFIFKRLTV